MMMECPRCGFTQPKDKYCASCGLDIDSFVAPQPSLLHRLVRNSSLHLWLIAMTVTGVIGYIVYSQSQLVSQQLESLLDLPLTSRDAADPEDAQTSGEAAAEKFKGAMKDSRADTNRSDREGEQISVSAADASLPTEKLDARADTARLSGTSKLEVTHWEVPHEAMTNLLALAEKLSEGSGGRAYLYPLGQKISEQVQNMGQKIAPARAGFLTANGQMTQETPPTTSEAFQFALFFQMTKMDAKELGLKWELNLVLPQPDGPGATATGPALRAAIEAALYGTATLTANSLLLLVVEPPHRLPREEFVARAGEGPWTVFNSSEFRTGLTDWVVTVQIR